MPLSREKLGSVLSITEDLLGNLLQLGVAVFVAAHRSTVDQESMLNVSFNLFGCQLQSLWSVGSAGR